MEKWILISDHRVSYQWYISEVNDEMSLFTNIHVIDITFLYKSLILIRFIIYLERSFEKLFSLWVLSRRLLPIVLII